jgi:hypothetical protein
MDVHAQKLPATAYRSGIKRVWFRLMPVLLIAYVLNYLDRTNIALAKTHLEVDLASRLPPSVSARGCSSSPTALWKSRATSSSCIGSALAAGSAGSSSAGARSPRSRCSCGTRPASTSCASFSASRKPASTPACCSTSLSGSPLVTARSPSGPCWPHLRWRPSSAARSGAP